MVLSLESVDLGSALVRKVGDGIMMLASELVNLLLVGYVGVFELMQPILLFARVVLLQALDLAAEALVVSDELLLVGAVFGGILLNANTGLSDVHLQLTSL